MTNCVAARRYANALFALGKKSGKKKLEQHGAHLAELESVLALSPELEKAFKSPVVSVEEKKSILGTLLQTVGADDTLRNFCLLLADKGRLSCLRHITTYYSMLLDAEKGVMRGRLLTAIPLNAKKQGELKALLEKKAGKSIELAFDVDKTILGGVVLTMGDKVLDASLRAQLAVLRDIIKRGE